MTEISKGGRLGGKGRSSVPGTVVDWELVNTKAAATAAAVVKLEAVIVLLLGDRHVGEGDILNLDNGLLRVGG